MGGLATKDFDTMRIDKFTLEQILGVLSMALYDNLRWYNPNKDYYKVDFVKFYDEKMSFGDCDLIGNIPYHFLEEKLKYREDVKILGVNRNGNVSSYAMRFKVREQWTNPFQVDYIQVSPCEYDFAVNYYAYNDLGNLLGRIASAFGYKFGYNGLSVKQYFNAKGEPVKVSQVKSEVEEGNDNSSSIKKEKVVISDFNEALKFLGYSPKEYAKGFRNVEEITRFVARGKYFHQDYFLMENRNHTQRARDQKRPTYNEALQYFSTIVARDKQTSREEFLLQEKRRYPITALAKRALRKEARSEYFFRNRIKASRIEGLLAHRFKVAVIKNGEVDPFDRTMIDVKEFGMVMKSIKENVCASCLKLKRKDFDLYLCGVIKNHFENKKH